MADLFDMVLTPGKNDMGLAGLLLGMGQGFSRAGQRGGSLLSGLGEAGGAGFQNMLGFQQFENADAMRKLQMEAARRKLAADDALRAGFGVGSAPAPMGSAPAPMGGAPAPMVGAPAPMAGAPAPMAGARPAPLISMLPPEIGAQITEVARADPQEALKLVSAYTTKMLDVGRWERVAGGATGGMILRDRYTGKEASIGEDLGQKMMLAQAGAQRSTTQISMNAESEFAKTVGGEQGKLISNAYKIATEAPKTLTAINTAREALDGGMFTGFGADKKLLFGKAIRAGGFNAYADEIANTEAFLASTGQLVAGVLSSGALGSGSGISSKDLEFVQRMSASDATLDEGSIRRILDISDRATRAGHKLFTSQRDTIAKDPSAWASLPPSTRALWGAVPSELPGFAPPTPRANPSPGETPVPPVTTAPRGAAPAAPADAAPRKGRRFNFQTNRVE